MPNYNSLMNLGGTGNAFAPFGNNGPQYDLRTTNPLNIGATRGTPQYMQSLRTGTSMGVDQTQSHVWDPMTGALSDTPVYNQQLGVYVSSKTGKPFTGKDAQGQNYVNGQQSSVTVPFSGGKQINPNNPDERYQSVNVVKSPEIASATQKMLDTFNKTADTALADFNEYLSNFKTQLGAASQKSAAAVDTTGTEAELRSRQAAYDAALQSAAARYAALNQDTAARENAVVQEARDLIPAYDAAANAAQSAQLAALQRNVSRYKALSGTPRSLGSGELRQLAAGAAAVSVPIEQAKIAQRYNVLSQYAMPVAQDIANRETSRVASFDPMVAAQQFQSGQATAQTIQQLAQVTANMSYDNAVKYMTSLSVPYEVQQKILTGQIGQLGGLAQLYGGSRYQGLQDLLGAAPTQSVYYNQGVPSYPGGSRYYPNPGPLTVNGGLDAGNGPKQVTQAPSGAQGDWVWDANNGRWQNWRTGETSRTGPWVMNANTGGYENSVTGAKGYNPKEEEALNNWMAFYGYN